MRVISVKESIFSNNDKTADELRATLKRKGTFLLNVMSSPGSGKTTLLTALLKSLKDKLKVVAMDVDIETDVDARRIAEGARHRERANSQRRTLPYRRGYGARGTQSSGV